MQYVNNDTHYQAINPQHIATVTESNNNQITGTFSGTLSTINMDNLTIAEGMFAISY